MSQFKAFKSSVETVCSRICSVCGETADAPWRKYMEPRCLEHDHKQDPTSSGVDMTINQKVINMDLRFVASEILSDPAHGIQLETDGPPLKVTKVAEDRLEIRSDDVVIHMTRDQAMQAFDLVHPRESYIGALRALRVACHRINDMLMGDDGQAWKEAEKALPKLLAAIPQPDAYLIRWNHRQVDLRGEKMNVPILDQDKRWELINKTQGQQLSAQKLLRFRHTDNHPYATVDIAPLHLA